jgi:hypothetical protein
VLRLLPDPAHEEDVVVRAEREEEDGDREGDVVGDLLVAEQRLEDEGGQPQRRGEGERAREQQVEGCDHGPQEDHEEDQIDGECRDRDANEVAGERVYGLGRERRLAR